jgi:hypothetical protein
LKLGSGEANDNNQEGLTTRQKLETKPAGLSFVCTVIWNGAMGWWRCWCWRWSCCCGAGGGRVVVVVVLVVPSPLWDGGGAPVTICCCCGCGGCGGGGGGAIAPPLLWEWCWCIVTSHHALGWGLATKKEGVGRTLLLLPSLLTSGATVLVVSPCRRHCRCGGGSGGGDE